MALATFDRVTCGEPGRVDFVLERDRDGYRFGRSAPQRRRWARGIAVVGDVSFGLRRARVEACRANRVDFAVSVLQSIRIGDGQRLAGEEYPGAGKHCYFVFRACLCSLLAERYIALIGD